MVKWIKRHPYLTWFLVWGLLTLVTSPSGLGQGVGRVVYDGILLWGGWLLIWVIRFIIGQIRKRHME